MAAEVRDEKVKWGIPARAPEKRRPGRPRIDEAAPLKDHDGNPTPVKARYSNERREQIDPEVMATHRKALDIRPDSLGGGVNVSWLSVAFRIDSRTARKRLAGLKPIGIGSHNSEIYDFVDAATYLAPPQQDKFARWMQNLKTSDMPVQIQDTYWAAMRKRQIWEQNAAHLWKTEDVVDVLAETFKTLKSTMQLWVDNLDDRGDMDDTQRTRLTQMVDGLQQELYHQLVDLPNAKRTLSSLYDPEVITNQIMDADEEDLIG